MKYCWEVKSYHNFEREIFWLKDKLDKKDLSKKNRKEILHQIRHKELALLFSTPQSYEPILIHWILSPYDDLRKEAQALKNSL